ncbi:Hypothetical predicted protein [Paramuricea clavata]|uniref:Uncharacterized protein n=1 Tax=Paramuricea clavata TaxID=317549 RepID=A0A6S7G309_PARCT|nr:Hypothetical predicted protein [Paramuricea clavata]
MPMDDLTKGRRTRAAHRWSAMKIGTKIKECLANASKEIVEVLVSNSEAEDAEQQLEKEIQETNDTRAELQKLTLDVKDALFVALPSLPQGQSKPSNLSMNATSKQIVSAKLPKLEVKRFNG